MEQIAELFLMILMGYIIVKTGLLKGEDSKVISKIVLYLVIPCVIINAFQVDYTSEKVKELLLVFDPVHCRIYSTTRKYDRDCSGILCLCDAGAEFPEGEWILICEYDVYR